MRITDDIPGIFEAPDVEQMTIKIDGKAIDDDQYKAELSEGITIEKEHRSPDGQGHTMMLTIGTRGPIGLKPNKKIEITYPLNAPDPSPGNERRRCTCSRSSAPSVSVPSAPASQLKHASVKVVHNRRNFSAGKQAIPAGWQRALRGSDSVREQRRHGAQRPLHQRRAAAPV